MGKDPRRRRWTGSQKYGFAVIASTLMIVLALSPLLFSGGITQLMCSREVVWPLIFGLLASMLVSFTLTALLCANLLRPASERDADRKHRRSAPALRRSGSFSGRPWIARARLRAIDTLEC